MFQRLDSQQAPVTREERQSAFQIKAAELLKDNRIDKDVAPIMLELIAAAAKDLTAEQKEVALKQAAEAQTKAIHSELGRMVERYAKTSGDPELIRDLKEKIISGAIEDYNSIPQLVNRYQTTGDVDWGKFDEFIVAKVTKYNGKGATKSGADDKPAAGGPAMKNDAPAGGVAQSQSTTNPDDLNEKQREIFNSQVSFGMKQAGLTREKAQERALSLINNAENKVKSSNKR